MNKLSVILRGSLRPLASLRLTVLCLLVGMLLIFAGTLDQVHIGIHGAQEKYFRSFTTLWKIPGLAFGNFHFGYLPLPGGYLIGSILLINLLAAHIARFRLLWRQIGILLIHIGIMLLLIGELLTGLLAEESVMNLDEGERSSYSESNRKTELVFIREIDGNKEQVVAIPEKMLENSEGETLHHPLLPFSLHIEKFMANAELKLRTENASALPSGATTGIGVQVTASRKARSGKPDEQDSTTALVELRAEDDGKLGKWLFSKNLRVQSFKYGGNTFFMSVRRQRSYKPFTLELVDFTHDRYAGTNIPKNFSSKLRLIHPAAGVNREVLVFMNNPLRYGGYTFYQQGFDNNDTTSILQVVRNPAWIMPYASCTMVGVGLIIQFGMHLVRFSRRRRKP
ncbi:MAG: cytochrome c biogenesis protein ResB [Verrucomicrobiaceae bacterium]|nr:cytochrome c biogenesis protein ResB [Verrucomicrobiaceae bacterium]